MRCFGAPDYGVVETIRIRSPRAIKLLSVRVQRTRTRSSPVAPAPLMEAANGPATLRVSCVSPWIEFAPPSWVQADVVQFQSQSV